MCDPKAGAASSFAAPVLPSDGGEGDLVFHPIPPEQDGHATILILGSFPSVASRASAYFYGHPQNRFWQVMAGVMQDALPGTVEEKRTFLHRHHVALWDVLASCRITGSADSSIREARANDLRPLLSSNPIRAIYLSGKTAERYYRALCLPSLGIPAVSLPSTSPANAAYTLPRLLEAWQIIKSGAGETLPI